MHGEGCLAEPTAHLLPNHTRKYSCTYEKQIERVSTVILGWDHDSAVTENIIGHSRSGSQYRHNGVAAEWGSAGGAIPTILLSSLRCFVSQESELQACNGGGLTHCQVAR